jgi:predicted CoA-substrate-specific enzyme activase
MAGGVSKNRAVVEHIRTLVQEELIADTRPLGALGAAFSLLEEWEDDQRQRIGSVEDVLVPRARVKEYFYRPLELTLSSYPDLERARGYLYQGDPSKHSHPVDVDLYAELIPHGKYEAYLGIDIGSTSTKAILADRHHKVLVGFYARTAGQPIEAVQQILASIADLVGGKNLDLKIAGVGTTGAGRKLIGKVVGADIVLDEITAHARAAVELNPRVDTIIEIGGQDSKFTVLRNGRVTFCVMNHVCAAGTGSFIEEQALKLGCELEEYSALTEKKRSPITSDRCTVFMERDIDHYLSEGYSAEEVLASVLHSVRDNYLTKVAKENQIGSIVLFQGATAKNKSLVAAFEQKLGKPIHVSQYCHLTGALGVAIFLADEGLERSRFRGLDLHKHSIPVRSEVCSLCTNHCKITVADVEGEPVAYGFLCGRDYETRKYVNNNVSGFDLLRERKKAFFFRPGGNHVGEVTIGIPAALHLQEDLPFWRKFFDALQIKTVTSEGYRDGVKEGTRLAGAEFCAPMSALYGHVEYLLEKVDYVFLPFYFERPKEGNARRQYCYYTQFAPSLVSALGGPERRRRVITPLVHYLYGNFHAKAELYRSLKSIAFGSVSFLDVCAAYDAAWEFKEAGLRRLREVYKSQQGESNDIHIVLLGRPYSILDRAMSKGIPEIFASQGIRVFFQDMLSYGEEEVRSVEPLLQEVHWHYASKILEAAEVVGQTEGAYPVLVTSFKCSPDSFVMDYFRTVMESHDKPYLTLQLDEHGSRVGYETRIEAAIRSFRNHWSEGARKRKAESAPSLISRNAKELSRSTLLFPAWDRLSIELVVANLNRAGLDARCLEGSDSAVKKSMRHNSGQCLPLNIIAQEFIDYIEAHDLEPERTILWMGASEMACNLKLYPHHIQSLLRSYGKGLERTRVYVGGLTLADISPSLAIDTYLAYMFGGFLRRMGCRRRPYEKYQGATDAAMERSRRAFMEAFLGYRSKENALAEVVELFEAIEVTEALPRPKVAIFGDLYTRDNEILNQDLVSFIEANGGEVITTPFSCYVQMIAKPYFWKWFIEGQYLSVLSSKALMATVSRLERRYYRYFQRVLNEPKPQYDESPQTILSRFNVRFDHTGESMDNLLKTYYIRKHYPDISLFVQASPAFCCPSLVTEGMSTEIERLTGIPVVSLTYDGTGDSKNEVIIPYLRYPKKLDRPEDRQGIA